MAWTPRIQSVAVQSRDRFALVLGELDYDRPFSAILIHDGAFAQPWTRVDVAREIVALAYAPGDGAIVTALSNEGDVYDIGEGAVRRGKILGAGLQSPDADGRGQVWDILPGPSGDLVVGDRASVYRREGLGADWRRLGIAPAPRAGFEPVSFAELAPLPTSGELILRGVDKPARPPGSLTEHPKFRADLSAAEVLALMAEIDAGRSNGGVLSSSVHLLRGETLTPLTLSAGSFVTALAVGGDGTVWIVGHDGLILRLEPGRALIPLPAARQVPGRNYEAAVPLAGGLVLLAGNRLWRFDGDTVAALDAPFVSAASFPRLLGSAGDACLVFDQDPAIHIGPDPQWRRIPLPRALLARSFDPRDL